MSWHFGFRPYVPVAQRRAQAKAYALKVAKKEKRELAPIVLPGRLIAASFWGKAWCTNLERYSDFENRLPRGRSYVRNGSVIDLVMERGQVRAIVSGSEVYRVAIDIKTLPGPTWSRIKKDCARSVHSLIDLLQGRFDQGIMERLTQRDGGLFPKPQEIAMRCSCPDWAGMCKHVAATLYGVGARLDKAPELLFILRDVDHLELISQAMNADNLNRNLQGTTAAPLAGADLGEIFGIELEAPGQVEAAPAEVAAQKSGPKARGKKKPTPSRKEAKTSFRADPPAGVASPKARIPKKASATRRKRTARAGR